MAMRRWIYCLLVAALTLSMSHDRAAATTIVPGDVDPATAKTVVTFKKPKPPSTTPPGVNKVGPSTVNTTVKFKKPPTTVAKPPKPPTTIAKPPKPPVVKPPTTIAKPPEPPVVKPPTTVAKPPKPPVVKPPPGKPVLSVSVTASKKHYYAPGQAIIYIYKISNTGKGPATTFALKDSKITTISCPPVNIAPNGGPIAAGATVSCAGRYTTTMADLGKDIASTVSVTGTSPAGPVPPSKPANTVVKFIGKLAAAVSMTPVIGKYSSTGEKFTFKISVKNTGSLPLNYDLFSNKATGIKCPRAKGGRGGPVTPGASVTCTGSYTTKTADLGGDIAITAGANISSGAKGKTTAKPTHVKLIFTGGALLHFTAGPAAGNTFEALGEKFMYGFTVRNHGTVPITSFKLTDTKVPASTIKCQTKIGGGYEAGPSWGPLEAGRYNTDSVATCIGWYVIKPQDIGKDVISTATVTGTIAKSKLTPPVPQSVKTILHFRAKPRLKISVKPAKVVFNRAGQRLTFTYTVRNTGNVPLKTFKLNDPNVRGITCGPVAIGQELARRATTTCKGTYTTTKADVGRRITSWDYSLSGNARYDPAKGGKTPVATVKRKTSTTTLFEDVPDIDGNEIKRVTEWIKKKTTQQKLPFCWKDSYGRGVGRIPGRVSDCPPTYTNNGLTCGRGADSIWAPSKTADCPSGYTNMGVSCFQPASTYGKSCSYAPFHFSKRSCDKPGYTDMGCYCGKGPKTISINNAKCPKGYFRRVAHCYKECPSGYRNMGLTCFRGVSTLGHTAMRCDPGEEMIGLRCFPKGKSCYGNDEKDGLLCYPGCKPGYDGVGPVCWGVCPKGYHNCGAGCAQSAGQCAMTVVNQVLGPLIVAANVASMGLASPATKGLTAATQTIKIAGKTVAGTSKLGKALVKVVKTLQTVKPSGLQKGAGVVKRIFAARTGAFTKAANNASKLSKINRATKIPRLAGNIGFQAYDAMKQYTGAYADDFANQTSREINDEIDRKFHPKTARFIKEQWAREQLGSMAKANNWAIADTVLSAVSLVDITGVTSVVGAYAKPKCQADIPFPKVAGTIR